MLYTLVILACLTSAPEACEFARVDRRRFGHPSRGRFYTGATTCRPVDRNASRLFRTTLATATWSWDMNAALVCSSVPAQGTTAQPIWRSGVGRDCQRSVNVGKWRYLLVPVDETKGNIPPVARTRSRTRRPNPISSLSNT